MFLTSNIKQRLDDFGWTQLQHDRFFHTDIYVLNTHNTLKHFTLHQSKYLSRILNGLDDSVNVVALADMFIILTATATACKVKTSDLVAGVKLPANHINDPYALMKMLINGVSLSAKVCEGLDHVEKQDYHHNLKISMSEIMESIYQLCTWDGLTEGGQLTFELLIRICKARLLQVELFSPQFKNLKAEMFEDRTAFADWYNKYLVSPTIGFLKSVHDGKYHMQDERYNGAINDLLNAPYKEYALRSGYLEKSLDGTLTLTNDGLVFIGVERSGIID